MQVKNLFMLSSKQRYLQIAINGSLQDAQLILSRIPLNNRILIEAGTPFIKRYGVNGIGQLRRIVQQRLLGQKVVDYSQDLGWLSSFLGLENNITTENKKSKNLVDPYIVADMKMMDRGATEVQIAAQGGANAVVGLGQAPIESLNRFVEACEQYGLDSMIDMMNVDQPYKILRKMKQLPQVVILHRGVDEERDSDKLLPIHMINKVKGAFNVMIAIAGGDTPREVQSAVFNGADIVVLWKNFYHPSDGMVEMVEEFLRKIK